MRRWSCPSRGPGQPAQPVQGPQARRLGRAGLQQELPHCCTSNQAETGRSGLHVYISEERDERGRPKDAKCAHNLRGTEDRICQEAFLPDKHTCSSDCKGFSSWWTPQPSGALGVLERPPRMGLPLAPQFTGSKTEEESKPNLP